MGKLCVIGIDGMDYHLVEKWRKVLPNLWKLQSEGFGSVLESIFPPDSIPAWITIYTGLDPSNHGIIEKIDYFGKNYKNFKVDTGVFRGKTFWDIAGQFKKKVCIINPFMAYPIWPVNGVMVGGPVFISGDNQAYPNTILNKYNLPSLGGIVDFPTIGTLKNFIDKTRKNTIAQADFGLQMLRDFPCDLYFIAFLTLDRIMHFLWRYCDEEDPTFPGKNEYQNTIIEFYKLFDQIIGRFSKVIEKDSVLMIISDHGHGRGCVKNVNLNEFLRQTGFLYTKVNKNKYLDKRYFIEKIKTIALNTLYALNLEDYVYKIAKYIPKKKELKTSSFIIERQKTLAYVPEFAGMGPFGGVCINKQRLKDKNLEYELFREKLIKELADIIDSKNGVRIAKWVCKRDVLFGGEYIEKLPDIIFELQPEYGVNWTLYSPIVTNSYLHKKISGKHTKNGVIFVGNCKKRINRNKISLVDITPTILDILDIDFVNHYSNKLNGKSIFK